MVRLFKVFMADDAPERVAETLLSGYVGQGERVEQFEHGLGELLGLPEPPLSVNSCTSAIELALRLIGVGPGDVVISTPMTCTATNSPAVLLGARIAWADVDPTTGLIDPESVSDLRDCLPDAKAVIAVDWAGRFCAYHRLWDFGPRTDPIPVVQDAAHSLLAQHEFQIGHPFWNRGDYVGWSFQAIKHLTCGDGGALLTPRKQTARARLLRWYGLDRRSKQSFRCEQNIGEVGGKWHMNDIAASIGLANLPHAKWVVEQHRANAAWYHEALADLDGITLPPPDPGSSWWLYCLLVDNRAAFMEKMTALGVETSQVHARNDLHTAFRAACVNPDDKLPGVEYFDAHQVSIPVGWWLSDEDRARVAEAVHISARYAASVGGLRDRG